jgi:hypothetical protein
MINIIVLLIHLFILYYYKTNIFDYSYIFIINNAIAYFIIIILNIIDKYYGFKFNVLPICSNHIKTYFLEHSIKISKLVIFYFYLAMYSIYIAFSYNNPIITIELLISIYIYNVISFIIYFYIYIIFLKGLKAYDSITI